MARKLAPDKWLFAATTGLALFGVGCTLGRGDLIAHERQQIFSDGIPEEGMAEGFGLELAAVYRLSQLLGHPVGMSGTRVVLHLANELKRRGGGVGAAALCGGGGQGDALIVRVPKS